MTQTMTSIVGFVLVLPGGWVADHWVENRCEKYLSLFSV
eukprot:COSAG06_NODE_7875_length_2346_cov_1.788607_4_plen_38_part_01